MAEKIDSIRARERLSLINDRHVTLALKLNASQTELQGQGFLIDPFQEACPQNLMNFDSCTDDCISLPIVGMILLKLRVHRKLISSKLSPS